MTVSQLFYVERISRGRHDLAVAHFDRDFASWRGVSIEPVVRQALDLLSRTDERLRGVEAVQAWWTRDGAHEVDVVATTREGTALVGTIKWRERQGVTHREVAQLAQQRPLVPRAEHAQLAAISPEANPESGADVTFTADDLLGPGGEVVGVTKPAGTQVDGCGQTGIPKGRLAPPR